MGQSLTWGGRDYRIPSWFSRVIEPGDEGPDVKVVRRKLGLDPDGSLDDLAVTRVKGVGRRLGHFRHEGSVDEMIAMALGETEAALEGLTPEWFCLRAGDRGAAVESAAKLLGLDTEVYSEEMEAAVRRHQSASRIEPNGILDVQTARSLGEL